MAKAKKTQKAAVTYKYALKEGEKCLVSYHGDKPGIFKNYRGGMAFVEFDDGTGYRLRKVFATMIKPVPAPKAETTAPTLSTKGMSAEQIIELAHALDTLNRLGYEVQELVG